MDESFTRAEAGLRCDLAAACTSAASKTKQTPPEESRELAQLTGSARQRRRIATRTKRIAKAP